MRKHFLETKEIINIENVIAFGKYKN